MTTISEHTTTSTDHARAAGGRAHGEMETGWLPATPPGDGIVLDSIRAMAAAYRAFAEAGGHPVVSAPAWQLVDTRSPFFYANPVHLLAPLAGDQVGALGLALTRTYGGTTGGPFLVQSPVPFDAAAVGLHALGHPPLMVRWATPGDSPTTDLEIRVAGDPTTLDDFERTLVEGYPAPPLLPWRSGCFATPALLETPWRFVVGYRAGEPVAVAAAFHTPEVVLVEMVATRPEHRGRGDGAAVTAAAAADAGGRPAVLVASDAGQPVYARLGFRRITRFHLAVGTR